jgi:hypothetical protein
MRGISLISGVLFLAFLIAATGIVYWTSVPLMQKMQCAAVTDKMKTTFVKLDKVIQTVASEGEGSKRTIDLNLDEGDLYINADNDTIYWKHECAAQIFSPRTFQTFGNIIMGANLDTSAYEGSCSGQSAFIIENEHLKACFRKIGSSSSYTTYNMSDVLLSIYQKDLNSTLEFGGNQYLDITLDDNETSKRGGGYTALARSGYNLPYGEVTAYMESDYGITYTIRFSLESGEDFLIIRGEE